jgi:galactitol-specific phosphotransferase system IIB component
VEASSLACGLTLVTSSVLCVASQVQAVQQTMHVTTYQQEQVQETGERLAGYDVSQTTSALAGYDVLETATTSQLTGYDTSAHYPVTARVLSGYDLYVTVARTAYACPPGWSDAGNGLCYTYATGTPHQAVSPPPNADIVGSTTEYKPVWWGYYCAVFGIGCFSAPTCHFGALWCWPVNKPYTVYTVVPLIKTYASGAATTTYTQQYEGFSQSCPSYAYQLGITCDPVYTTQTSYQRGSLGQLSYCPAPNRYTGSY